MTNEQRRRISALATGVIALTLGAVLWISRTQDDATVTDTVLELDSPDAIRRVVLENPKGTALLERTDTSGAWLASRWRLVRDPPWNADNAAVRDLLSYLLELQALSEVTEQAQGQRRPPLDLGVFGLAPPLFRVSLTDTLERTTTLLVGKRNTFNGHLYAAVDGRPNVYLVPGSLRYALERDASDLREKVLLANFDVEGVAQITVQRREKHDFYLDRKEGWTWRIGESAHPASPEAVKRLLALAKACRASRFLVEDPTASELHRWGLDSPEIRVAFAGPSYEGQLDLSSTDEGVVATAGDTSPIVRLEGRRLWEALSAPAEAFRDMRVLGAATALVAEDVVQIKMQSEGLEFGMRRLDPEDPTGLWVSTEVGAPSAGLPLKRSEVWSLLHRLWELRAEQWEPRVEDWEAEARTITLTSSKGDSMVLEFRDRDDAMQALVVGQSGGAQREMRVAQVRASFASSLGWGLDHYLEVSP